MVFPSTPGVSVRVLRPMFVPGCGGPHEFVNSVSFSHFLCAVTPTPLCFSFTTSLLDHPPFLLSLFPYFPFSLSPSLSSLLPPLSIFFSLLSTPPALLPASKVPWEPCGLSAGRHTNTTAATTGTSLFLPLRPLPRSLLFFFLFPLHSLSLFFSSSLFNVEVLSNCWLLLWLGGNGIFRRMPHAVALTHSWVPTVT